ncbi:MAG: response regulator transcription factor [Cyanobacteria bacterium J06641_5]
MSEPQASPQKLLVVDDEPSVRAAVEAYLKEEGGFEVRVAANPKEAWEVLGQWLPDLVITDVMMPEVNGYEFLEQLRADPRFLSLPVVFLTAKGMTADRIQGYNAGVDHYLSKPFDPDELVSIARNILERRSASLQSNPAAGMETISKQLSEILTILDNPTARNPQQKPAVPDIHIDLTPREQSVLTLVAEGLMNKEIARRLETSVRNVEKYVSRLFQKTGTNSRTELVRYALEHGLTD